MRPVDHNSYETNSRVVGVQTDTYHRALHAADAYMCGLLGMQLCTRMHLNKLVVEWLGVPPHAPQTCSAQLQQIAAAQLKPAAYVIDDAPDWWYVATHCGSELFLVMVSWFLLRFTSRDHRSLTVVTHAGVQKRGGGSS